MSKKNLPACQALAAEHGLADMFSPPGRSPEDLLLTGLEKVRDAAAHYHKHGFYPKDHKTIAGWLNKMRMAKAGKGRENGNSHQWNPEYEKEAIRLGCPDMFERTSDGREQRALDNTRRVVEFKKECGKYPTNDKSNKDPILGEWLMAMRRAKAGTKKGGNQWYPSCEELAKELGFPDMFEQPAKSWENKALERTREAVMYHKEHGKFPDGKTDSLGKWICKMRQAKAGRGGSAWYSSCDETAAELGLPDLFDLERK